MGGDGEEGRGGSGGTKPRFLLDRSKVRILLCDNNAESSQEVLQLLCNCSYQVTSVRTARQVLNVLDAQGPDIDIILAEVDLPIAKGFKLLKYLTRDKELRRIPIIMMSTQDEVSVVVKCLRLGAADYLVKPLRTNELLTLWTHVWKRRRMVGLAEKDILGNVFEFMASEPSDANTNSMTLFSDDTDDRLRMATQLETSVSNPREYQSNASAMETEPHNSSDNPANLMEDGVPAGGSFSRPKKTSLKVGESSAFLTYVKPSASTSTSLFCPVSGNTAPSGPLHSEKNVLAGGTSERYSIRVANNSDTQGKLFVADDEVPDLNTFPSPVKFPMSGPFLSDTHLQSRSRGQIDASGVPSILPLPVYFQGMMEQKCSSVQLYQGNLNDAQANGAAAIQPQYNVLPQCLHMPMMPAFPYFPVGINLHSGHIPATHLLPSMPSLSAPEVKFDRSGRREAALIKFRQKRKDRCFDKKIRYINRKRLAEKRPRIRGQFVRKVNGQDVHLNGFPSASYEAEEDEGEESISRELELASSPVHNDSEF